MPALAFRHHDLNAYLHVYKIHGRRKAKTSAARGTLPATSGQKIEIFKLLNRLFIFLVPLLISCRQKPETNNNANNAIEKKEAAHLKHAADLKYFMKSGEQLFKNNCGICHGSPTADVEPGGVSFSRVFKGLSIDSLPHYEKFVRNSKDIRTNAYAPHEFGKTMPDSLIKTVVQYLWAVSQPSLNADYAGSR